jgi:hypothetical protein
LAREAERRKKLQEVEEFSSIIAKLEVLRSLREKKLTSQGTRFRSPPTELLGREVHSVNYFEQLLSRKAEGDNQDKEPGEEVTHATSLTNTDTTDPNTVRNNMTEEVEQGTEPEDPRLFYYSAYSDLDSLIRVRSEWDRYIVPPGTSGGSAIPSHFVSPPSNPSFNWSLYVIQKKVTGTGSNTEIPSK